MATINMTHVVKDASNVALAGIPVVVTLSKAAFRSDDSQVARRKEYTTDVAGLVTMVLEINSQLDPSDTHWIVDIELPPKHGGPQRYTALATVNQSLHDSII